jgi:hypothetical protein
MTVDINAGKHDLNMYHVCTNQVEHSEYLTYIHRTVCMYVHSMINGHTYVVVEFLLAI